MISFRIIEASVLLASANMCCVTIDYDLSWDLIVPEREVVFTISYLNCGELSTSSLMQSRHPLAAA